MSSQAVCIPARCFCQMHNPPPPPPPPTPSYSSFRQSAVTSCWKGGRDDFSFLPTRPCRRTRHRRQEEDLINWGQDIFFQMMSVKRPFQELLVSYPFNPLGEMWKMLADGLTWHGEPVKDWKSFKIHRFGMSKQEIHPDVWKRRKADRSFGWQFGKTFAFGHGSQGF